MLTNWITGAFLLLAVQSGCGLPRCGRRGNCDTHAGQGRRHHGAHTEVPPPPNRKSTAGHVARLRAAMVNTSLTGGARLDAYVIHYGDQHMGSETDHDRRLQFISGFSGTSGYAAVTATRAALWANVRDLLQADQELDCDWSVMQIGGAADPALPVWLQQQVPGGTVGADPRLVPISAWVTYSETLVMHELRSDLADDIWMAGRPTRQNNPLHIHHISFAGRTWQDKVSEVRAELAKKRSQALVITALDETAWLLNLRGKDRPTSPLFDAYSLVTYSATRLYIRNTIKQLTSSIAEHLNTNMDGSCTSRGSECVEVVEYAKVMGHIRELAARADVERILIPPDSNYAVFSAAGEKGEVDNSPVALLKSIKNPVERDNYYRCQVRDSAAVVEFAALLEREVSEGKPWTELSAAHRITEIRRTYDYYWGVSFAPISSVGANSAVLHYRPNKATDRALSTAEVYLIDSGGQYQDGTTDVTRTFHFGTPTDEQKEAYTRVLMAHIDLATTVWPSGLKGNAIDARARGALWERGWDFRHGAGHGIGAFLQVHEGPAQVGPWPQGPQFEALQAGMFFSDEPGFYQKGEYGIRLESIMEIVKAETASWFGDIDYLTFNPVTLVPFEPKFILVEMLSTKQKRWYNAYHRRCETQTGGLLRRLGKTRAVRWLTARTARIPELPARGRAGNWSPGRPRFLPAGACALLLVVVRWLL